MGTSFCYICWAYKLVTHIVHVYNIVNNSTGGQAKMGVSTAAGQLCKGLFMGVTQVGVTVCACSIQVQMLAKYARFCQNLGSETLQRKVGCGCECETAKQTVNPAQVGKVIKTCRLGPWVCSISAAGQVCRCRKVCSKTSVAKF